MKSKFNLIVACLIIFVIIGINISYAISMPTEAVFFEVSKTEITVGETLEMTFDLSKLDENVSKLILSSNVELQKIYVGEESLGTGNTELESNSEGITISLDKEQLNLNKIVLCYQIPESMEMGTVIKLTAKAISKIEEQETVLEESIVDVTVVEETVDNSNEKIEGSDEEKASDKKDNTMQSDGSVDNMQNANQTVGSIDSMQSTTQIAGAIDATQSASLASNSVSAMSSASQGTSSNIITATATAVYNGSCNNYLSSLEIDEVNLTTDFSKEVTTYFAKVDDIDTITVNAVAEDSGSIVAITGENLTTGTNKVLISVTAENGDVRYYRIFVTKG